MSHYYIVGLTQEEVAGHALSRISDIVRQEFLETSQAAIKRKILNPKQVWMKIYFESPLTSPKFAKEYKEYFSVLYLDEESKNLFEEKGVKLNIIGKTETLPEDIGVFISMPCFLPS